MTNQPKELFTAAYFDKDDGSFNIQFDLNGSETAAHTHLGLTGEQGYPVPDRMGLSLTPSDLQAIASARASLNANTPFSCIELRACYFGFEDEEGDPVLVDDSVYSCLRVSRTDVHLEWDSDCSGATCCLSIAGVICEVNMMREQHLKKAA